MPRLLVSFRSDLGLSQAAFAAAVNAVCVGDQGFVALSAGDISNLENGADTTKYSKGTLSGIAYYLTKRASAASIRLVELNDIKGFLQKIA